MQSAFTPFAGYQGPQLQVVGEQAAAPQTTAMGNWPSALNPQNPLFWFGVLAATTLGLMAVSGSVKLGPAKVSAKVGD